MPPFMLRKIKAYVLKRALSGDLNADSPQPSTSSAQEDKFKIDDIKLEAHDDFDSANFNASQYMTNADNSRDFPEDPLLKEDADFADIKVKSIFTFTRTHCFLDFFEVRRLETHFYTFGFYKQQFWSIFKSVH